MTNRITDHNELFFRVGTVPVLADVGHGPPQRIPGKKAVVNCENDRVFAVVSDSYQLVPNRQAVDYGRQCCETAFPDTRADEWEIQFSDAPGTAGHCFVDLLHKTAAMNFNAVPGRDRGDAYGPFVRVTNSYNRTRALKFEIGLLRWRCSNGMIFPESSVSFKYAHSHKNLLEQVEFEISSDRFASLTRQFRSFLEPLRAQSVPRQLFVPIVRAALGVTPPPEAAQARREAWNGFVSSIGLLTDKYAWELGPNGYALMNVITDIASRPHEYGLRRERHGLQVSAGTWLADFSQECKQRDFDVELYAQSIQHGPEKRVARPRRRPVSFRSPPVAVFPDAALAVS